ncbi:MAG: hypothetical protein HY329_02370 [Chloroflexi bacterium]|nr:hypothetical protein [Chloroflexota bacterium]
MARLSPELQRELERALEKVGRDEPPTTRRSAPQRAAAAARRPDLRLASPTPVLITGVALVLAGWLLPRFALGSLAVTLGLVVLGLGVASWLLRPPQRASYWRGRRIEWDEGANWRQTLYFAFYRE